MFYVARQKSKRFYFINLLTYFYFFIITVWYEPTDVKKACKIFDSHPDWQKVLQFISPNVKELLKIGEYFSLNKEIDASKDPDVEVIKEIAIKLGEFIPVVFTTMGPNGLLASTFFFFFIIVFY